MAVSSSPFRVVTPGAAAAVPHLSVEGVSLSYQASRGPVQALDDLSLTVAQGEFVSVLGPSGCGKSTLLKLVSGLMRPTAGRISLNGKEVTGTRSDVGIVFQKPTLLPWRTVLNNVLAPIRAMKGDARAHTENALNLLTLVGLQEFANNYPNELSGGMQQRVAIARGLAHDPGFLLMDEPFAALDALTREHMMLELQRIWLSRSKSVLFITHSIPEAVFLSDRILVMSSRPGRIVQEVRVELPRPRTLESMSEKPFNDCAKQLRQMFSKA
ncbi:MAG: transporter ATP-binding protein [Paucimonas sp.]|jgi:NitT/TauT family transport system ATP-binding protein|nr:transporter ATP-binding protein [Paucimonas sp.]